MPASSVPANVSTIAATSIHPERMMQQQQAATQQVLQQQQQLITQGLTQQILQKAQADAISAQQQLAATMANMNTNLYFEPTTGQYFDTSSGAVNTPTLYGQYSDYGIPMAAKLDINPTPNHQGNQSQNLQGNSDQMAVAKTDGKKVKNKKKGIGSSVKWLYIISDAKRECYGSLCRGQFDSITTTKWLTSLYEEAEWGNGVKDRSRNQGDGPTPNHIAWYTAMGCSCTLNEDEVHEVGSAASGFPAWLQQITDTIVRICACDRNPPNCAELFFFENKASRWNWHNYCEDDVFGLDSSLKGNVAVAADKRPRGQTVHLLIGNRRQFQFAPRKTKAVPGDEEKSVYLENGDVFVTCGKFSKDYVMKIDCEGDAHDVDGVSRAHSSMYIVWRWIVDHNKECPLAQKN